MGASEGITISVPMLSAMIGFALLMGGLIAYFSNMKSRIATNEANVKALSKSHDITMSTVTELGKTMSDINRQLGQLIGQLSKQGN